MYACVIPGSNSCLYSMNGISDPLSYFSGSICFRSKHNLVVSPFTALFAKRGRSFGFAFMNSETVTVVLLYEKTGSSNII